MSDKKLLVSVDLDGVAGQTLEKIITLFEALNIRSTCFMTIGWAQCHPALMQQLATRHEIALYAQAGCDMGYDQLKGQRETLECLSGSRVYGFRNAGTRPADAAIVKTAGFIYQAVEPVHTPRTLFLQKDLWMIPLSASPLLGFALTAHNVRMMPEFMIQHFSNIILKKDRMMSVSYPLTGAASLLQFLHKKGQFCANIDWLQDQLQDDN